VRLHLEKTHHNKGLVEGEKQKQTNKKTPLKVMVARHW
jgi:hypothetical protein